MASVEIVLATCSSERYLAELLESLFQQTVQDFTILVADDGSSDSTLSILAGYQKRHPGRIRMLEFPAPAGGPLANFARLIEQISADYAMLCDHDDVWLPNKVADCLERVRYCEAAQGRATPILVFTDLAVVGADPRLRGRSFYKLANINPRRNGFRHLLIQSVVPGCTVLMNRALYELARPISNDAVMHDHWCSLVAAAFGRLEYVDEKTILYRQHDRNAVGVQSWSLQYIASRIYDTLLTRKLVGPLVKKSEQARAFLHRYRDEMTCEQRETVAVLADLWQLGRGKRFSALLRKGLLMQDAMRNIALLITVTCRDRRRLYGSVATDVGGK